MPTITGLFADVFSRFFVRKEILQQGRNKRAVLHELDINEQIQCNYSKTEYMGSSFLNLPWFLVK